MSTEFMDLKGLKCPQPILKIGVKSPKMSPGDIIELVADCHTIENDVRRWCERMGKTLLWIRPEAGTSYRAQIQF